MSFFDYLAMAFSLVFALSAVRLVSGLPYALAPARRSWIHLAFVLHELMRVAAGFWFFWSYREIEWTFPLYLLALVAPCIVYFLAAALVPEDPSHVLSWEHHYFELRRRYFLGTLAWVGVVTLSGSAIGDQPLGDPARLTQVLLAGLAITGAWSESLPVHRVLAAIAVALPLLATFSDLLR